MNRLSLLAILAVLLFAGVQTQAQEDQYVQIYNLIQEADASLSSDQPMQSLNKYLRAQTELQRFQKLYPDWNPASSTSGSTTSPRKSPTFPESQRPPRL